MTERIGDSNDLSALLVIAVFACAFCSTASLLTRLAVRRQSKQALQKDDYTYLAAVVFGVGQGAVTLYAAFQCLARRVGLCPSGTKALQQLTPLTNALYLLAIYLARISIIQFIYRVYGLSLHDWRSITLLRACALCGVLSVGLLVVPRFVYDSRLSVFLGDEFVRWTAIESMGCLLDSLIIALPLYPHSRRRMLSVSHTAVVAQPALLLLTLIFGVLRTLSYRSVSNSNTPRREIAKMETLLQLEMCCILITTTMPALLRPWRVLEAGMKDLKDHKQDHWPEVNQTTAVAPLKIRWSSRTAPLSLFEFSEKTITLPNGKRGETITEIRVVDQDVGVDMILRDAIVVRRTVTVEYELCWTK